MRWGRPSTWHPLANVRLLGVAAILIIGSLASGAAALTVTGHGPNVFRSAPSTATTAPSASNALAPVVIGSNENATADDPLVKVAPGDSDSSEAQSGSADGGGTPRGYTGLFKLGGLVLFLVFAWGWWAWGGELPVRPAVEPNRS
jgi:hypothetical protein